MARGGLQGAAASRRKRPGASTGQAPVTAAYRNHVWAIDVQHDHLQDGTGFKIASILDEHTRLILDDTVEASITGEDLAAILDSIALEHGFPEYLRMDNGPEMACNALADWADQVVGLVFIPPGEPWKNGSVESFHSRQRDEFSSITTFASLLYARVELTDWHHEYNHVRRHSSLGYQTPAEYAANCTCTKPD